MYTMMDCRKLAGVNVEAWLTYFLDHVYEYDNDYSLDIADFLPSSLVANGLLKTSEKRRKSLERLQSLLNTYTWFTECLHFKGLCLHSKAYLSIYVGYIDRHMVQP